MPVCAWHPRAHNHKLSHKHKHTLTTVLGIPLNRRGKAWMPKLVKEAARSELARMRADMARVVPPGASDATPIRPVRPGAPGALVPGSQAGVPMEMCAACGRPTTQLRRCRPAGRWSGACLAGQEVDCRGAP